MIFSGSNLRPAEFDVHGKRCAVHSLYICITDPIHFNVLAAVWGQTLALNVACGCKAQAYERTTGFFFLYLNWFALLPLCCTDVPSTSERSGESRTGARTGIWYGLWLCLCTIRWSWNDDVRRFGNIRYLSGCARLR